MLRASILIGSVPGIYVGARFSSRASDRVIRPLLAITLAASGLELLGASNASVAGVLGLACVVHHHLNAQRSERASAASEV